MIFSGQRKGASHIDLIKIGMKVQTRRMSAKYEVGKVYSIQPKRCSSGIVGYKIRIKTKWHETKEIPISEEDAFKEGGYTPAEYETVFERTYPGWKERWAYEFTLVEVRRLI